MKHPASTVVAPHAHQSRLRLALRARRATAGRTKPPHSAGSKYEDSRRERVGSARRACPLPAVAPTLPSPDAARTEGPEPSVDTSGGCRGKRRRRRLRCDERGVLWAIELGRCADETPEPSRPAPRAPP